MMMIMMMMMMMIMITAIYFPLCYSTVC